MTEIRFYHLQTKPMEQALPEILGKALERGFRIVVKADNTETVQSLDEKLWTYDSQSFLPHASGDNDNKVEQPIWLTADDENPNNANMLVLLNAVQSNLVSTSELCCEVFDGNDDEVVAKSRERWKEYATQGYGLSYFQQDENGKWQKKK